MFIFWNTLPDFSYVHRTCIDLQKMEICVFIEKIPCVPIYTYKHVADTFLNFVLELIYNVPSSIVQQNDSILVHIYIYIYIHYYFIFHHALFSEIG